MKKMPIVSVQSRTIEPATGGEKLVRRDCPELDSGLTNPIRLVVTASLLANGEGQTFEKSLSSWNGERKPIKLRGSVGKQ